MKSDVKEVMIVQTLTEVLFEEAFLAQQKYEQSCSLYGENDKFLKSLFQYEVLHDVIERAGLITEYTMFYREKERK